MGGGARGAPGGPWWEHCAASGGEFEGQRQAVQATADLGNGLRIVSREHEIGLHLAHTLDEERDRWDLRQGLEVGEGRSRWQCKRQDRNHPLVAYPQWLATRHEQCEPWGGVEQPGRQGGGGKQLLGVVQQQEELSGPQICQQAVTDRLAVRLGHSERPGHGQLHEFWVFERG